MRYNENALAWPTLPSMTKFANKESGSLEQSTQLPGQVEQQRLSAYKSASA